MKEIIKIAFLNALGTALYITVLALFMFNNVADKFDNNVLAPILMLCLFVLSAAVTGSLILGRPILWYLDGRKKEALYLFIGTLGIFLVITIIVFCLAFLA